MIDETHDPGRSSWVASANGHPDFPIQNLPLCVFSRAGGGRRGGVGIGDSILDLAAAAEAGLFSGEAARAATAASGPVLNPLMALGPGPRRALRRRLSQLLEAGSAERAKVEPLLVDTAVCALHLPAAIGDYTDFYAGIHHALNVGRQFRPDNPLLPNYKYVPIGYHGRASSMVVSGTPVHRPNGQRKGPDETEPSFGPCRRLDYELELGIWIGPGNPLGQPISIEQARDHLVGVSLLNDWSARDIQAWEYQPLGPFLAKNFASTLSPWVVTLEAIEPFRTAQPRRPAGDPAPLPYLSDAGDRASGAFDIEVEALISTAAMRAAGAPPVSLSRCSTRELYWTLAQMVAHHTSGGCNLAPGDLFGSGTISSADPDNVGSLLELTQGGKRAVDLPGGESRRFLEDGDEVIFRGACRRAGFVTIGLGECRGQVIPAA